MKKVCYLFDSRPFLLGGCGSIYGSSDGCKVTYSPPRRGAARRRWGGRTAEASTQNHPGLRPPLQGGDYRYPTTYRINILRTKTSKPKERAIACWATALSFQTIPNNSRSKSQRTLADGYRPDRGQAHLLFLRQNRSYGRSSSYARHA